MIKTGNACFRARFGSFRARFGSIRGLDWRGTGGDYLKEVVYLWWGSGSEVDFII